jgi:hypothetical protein
MTGALIGAALGLAGYVVIRMAASQIEGLRPSPEQRRRADILRAVGLADLLVFPIIGYFAAPLVLD